jgi:transposase-like protein
VLVELSVMEQRYQAVLAVVQDGWKVTEVAERLGVSRQSAHAWIARYEAGGLPALVDRSHRPASCPHQILGETEAPSDHVRILKGQAKGNEAAVRVTEDVDRASAQVLYELLQAMDIAIEGVGAWVVQSSR